MVLQTEHLIVSHGANHPTYFDLLTTFGERFCLVYKRVSKERMDIRPHEHEFTFPTKVLKFHCYPWYVIRTWISGKVRILTRNNVVRRFPQAPLEQEPFLLPRGPTLEHNIKRREARYLPP